MSRVRVTINEAELRRLTQARSREIVRHVDSLGRRVANQAKRNIKVDEGTARASIFHTVDVEGTRVVTRIGSPLDYPLYLQVGTGLYGPKKKLIFPTTRKVLRFEVRSGKAARGNRPVVFAAYVRGIKGDQWLTRALETVSPYPVRIL